MRAIIGNRTARFGRLVAAFPARPPFLPSPLRSLQGNRVLRCLDRYFDLSRTFNMDLIENF